MLLIVGLTAVPGSALLAEPELDEPTVELTWTDVRVANEKAAAAYGALVTMWTREFRDIGYRFAPPRMLRHRSPVYSPCGVLPSSNASYCLSSNTIYFDDVFLASQAKVIGSMLGTDGDMAAVGIIAHEMGHAVAMQLGYRSRSSYDNESVADCLAGAFARQAHEDGSLEEGDVDEAFHAMAAAGDPDFIMAGGRRDPRLQRAIRRSSHGTREQRMANFREGLEGGPGVCLEELRPT
jgi:predicted metalloprotease